MISHTTPQFRKIYRDLPQDIREQARKAYRLFVEDPYHPSLHFKRVHPSKPIYSARINQGYRTLAVRENEELIWFWIGSHADYDKIISQL